MNVVKQPTLPTWGLRLPIPPPQLPMPWPSLPIYTLPSLNYPVKTGMEPAEDLGGERRR